MIKQKKLVKTLIPTFSLILTSSLFFVHAATCVTGDQAPDPIGILCPIFRLVNLVMLLGGAVYESIVMAPNYRTDVPQSLDHIRNFMKVTTPANYFRVFSPVMMVSLILTTVLCWESLPARWWFLGAFAGLVLTDTITYAFHYPRNKILFIFGL